MTPHSAVVDSSGLPAARRMRGGAPHRLAPVLALVLVAAAAAGGAAPVARAADGRGKVTGRVLASDSGEPVGFADVLLTPIDSTSGQRVGSMTNADGTFLLSAEPGAYNLQIRAISYSRKLLSNVIVTAGVTRDVSVTMSPEALMQEEIVVEAKAVRNTEAALLNARRKATAVGDAVSAEQVRRSPDRDAGDVLRRVTGTSLFEGKYVYVRGMGERYSSTEMDGVRVASPEQNKRVVPLDLVPSSLLENIVVQKTYTADRPGEFGGGDVQIHTRDFPGRRTLSFSASAGYDPTTSWRSVQGYDGGGTDWLSFGVPARDLPDAFQRIVGDRKLVRKSIFDPGTGFSADTLALIGQSFRNQWDPRARRGLPSGSYLLSYGDEFHPWGRSLGVVASLGLSNGLSRTVATNRFFEGAANQLVYDYDVLSYTQSAQFSASSGVSCRLGPAHTLALKGTLTRSSDDEVRSYEGLNISQNANFQSERLDYVERSIGALALEGKHELRGLGRSRLAWTASLTRATRDEPDRRETLYRQNVDDGGAPLEPYAFYTSTRDFGALEDRGKGIEGKWTLPLPIGATRDAHLDFGSSYQARKRDSVYRRFQFSPSPLADLYAPPESLFQDNQWNSTFLSAHVEEITQPEDAYRADTRVTGTFVSADLPATRALRAIAGVRLERGVQQVNTYDFFSGRVNAKAELANWDWLPTLNLVYALDGRTNLRAAAARTLSRPDLRELTPGRTLTFFNGYQDIGNPELRRATIWNYDLRIETFPGLSQVLAAGLFYKRFTDPIEKVIVPGGSDRLLKPFNSESGRNYGVEVEARTGLGRVARRLEHFTVNANGSIISSNVVVGQQTTLTTSPEHPLQGQSNYLVNVGFGYSLPQRRLDAVVLVNRVGRRLFALGRRPTFQDIYEEPSTTLDVVVNWAPVTGMRVKFAGKNLTNEGFRTTQGGRELENRDANRTFSLGVSLGS